MGSVTNENHLQHTLLVSFISKLHRLFQGNCFLSKVKRHDASELTVTKY